MRELCFVNLFLGVGLQGVSQGTAASVAPASAGPNKGSGLPPGVMTRLGPVRYLNSGRVLTLAFAPDGRLAAGCWDGMVWLGDPVGKRILRSWQAHDGMIRALAFSPDGKMLASTNAKGEVR